MQTEEQARELLLSEAKKVSGLSVAYLARLIKGKQIQGRKLGPIWLIDRASLSAYVNTYHKPGPRGPRQKQTGAPDSTPASHLTGQPSQKGRNGASAATVTQNAPRAPQETILDTPEGVHIRIDTLAPQSDQWMHAEATQGDMQASMRLRPYGPGARAYILDKSYDRLNASAPGRMGRKQEARAKALLALLERHMQEAMLAAGWAHAERAPGGAELWRYSHKKESAE